MQRRIILLVFAAVFLCTFDLTAQKTKIPNRPRLLVSADTNDAAAYLQLADSLLVDHPRQAAGGFYWASQLEPAWAEPLYGLRAALMLDDKFKLQRYMEGDRSVIRSKEMLHIDSLQYRALMMNPFIYRRYDRHLFDEYLRFAVKEAARKQGQVVLDTEIDHWLLTYLQDANAPVLAWAAYARHDFDQAVKYYTNAIKSARKDQRYLYYADRGRIQFLRGRADSAQADLQQALAELRTQDQKKLVFFYESKAVYEHSIAVANEQLGDLKAAREAYGRALQEDLSYYPAHLGTGRLALLAGDTTAAVAALDLATQVKPDDSGIRFTYAQILNHAHRFAEAETQLRKAIELNPYFAAPYALLGDALLAQNKPDDALAQFKAFLTHAALRDPLLPAVKEHVRLLQNAPASGIR